MVLAFEEVIVVLAFEEIVLLVAFVLVELDTTVDEVTDRPRKLITEA